MTRFLRCKACECVVAWKTSDVDNLSRKDTATLQTYHKTHCLECALELAFGMVGPSLDTNHGTGGGRRVIHGTKSLS